ncbi:MAG: alpha/beta hydrolase [Elusimicrobia bacterium]|nr:alpha/beta hydrolase [Elusimicrobiota bacterium]
MSGCGRILQSKITTIAGKRRNPLRPVICFIPGGPGLSSKTLTGIEIVSRSFDLAFIDPPGTGGLPDVQNPTFLEVVYSLAKELRTLQRPLILVGHSFGGYYAARCLADPSLGIVGLVMLSAPMTPDVYAVCCKRYEEYKSQSPTLADAEAKWESSPTNDNLRAMLASYGPLYFTEPFAKRGCQLLLTDRTSCQSFLNILDFAKNRTASKRNMKLIENFNGGKLFVAAEKDHLLPINQLERDAKLASLPFRVVPNSGHFATLENPNFLAGLLEKYFLNGKKEVP